MTVKKQHAPDLMSGGAIRDGKGRIIDQTYALKTEVLAGTTNVTEGTFDELPANPNEGDIHILTEPYIDEDYTEGLVNPKLERVKYHTGTEFIKGETAWNRISNTGNKVNEWDYRVKTHFIPSTGVVKIARIDMYSNITFRAIYNVPAPAKETASCTISFKSGSAVGVTDNKYAVANLCFYKDGITNYLCIKPNGLVSITIDLYDVNVYRGGLTPIEPVALTTEQLANVTTFTELGQSKEIVIDPTDTDNVLTLGLRKETQDDNTAYLDFNANSGIEAIDLEKGYYHILNSTIFEQSVFYWNGKTCYKSGGNYTTPVEVDSIDNVLLELDYINPGTYYFVTTKPINNSFSVSSQRSITKNITNSYESVIPADTTIGFTITEDNIAFFKKNEGTYITDINGCFPDETGSVDLNSQFVTLFTPQRIEGEKKFPNQTYIEHLYFETGVITPNSPLLEKDFTGNLGLFRSKLNLSRSGDIQLGDTYAVTGETVYNYVNNNVVTVNGNQTITGTKNFEDLEVNNSIEFNSGLNTTPIGSITVNNNELQIKDAKLELTESGNIELGDNYAVTANDVLTFVDNRTNITTINSSGFNFNNSGNFPEINKTKTFMAFGNINVTNGPIATLKPNTLIQYYRTDTIDDVSYLMQVVTIADQTNNIIYARKLTFENNQWSAGTWQILSNSLNLTNVDFFSILQTNSGNTYGSSGNSLYNTIFGGFNVLASSNSSAVFGSNNTVQGNNVFVAGKQNDNNHNNNTTIFGTGNITKTAGATIVGTWSNTDATSYFTIGNGYDNTHRSNLFDIKNNGDIIIKRNGNDVRLQDCLSEVQEINICIIGNSFTLDSFQYVPAIARDLGVSINIVQIYKGGSTSWQISTYKDILVDNTQFFNIYQYDHNSTSWSVIKNNNSGKFTDVKALYNHFDFVIINQYSVANVSEIDTVEPSQLLVTWLVQDPVFKGAKFGFFASPVYANGYENLTTLGFNNSQEMWMAQTEVNKKAILSAFDFFIPANTAIENARTNASIDALGTFGHLSFDGQHLQEGLPCFISAVTSLYVLLEQILGYKVSTGTSINPDSTFLSTENIQGIHGACVGISNMNKSLAYHCVKAAIEQPYQISVINSLGAIYKDYYVNTNRVQTIEALKQFNNGINLGGSNLTEVNNAIEITTNDFNVNAQSVKVRRSYSSNTKARILSNTVYGSGWNDNGESNYPRLVARKEVDGVITETTSVAMHDNNIAFALNRTTIFGVVNSNSGLDQDWTSNQIPTKNAIKSYVENSISTKADDSNVVHKTGDENIAGVKSFTDTMKFGSSSTVDLVKNGSAIELQKATILRIHRIYTSSERRIALNVYGTTDGDAAYPRLVAQTVNLSENEPVTTETTSVALRDNKVSFALNRTTEWGFVNATSNSNENWNTKEIPTKTAVATKISAEISNATDIHCVHLTYSGSDSGYLDHTLTEHHRTTYIYVSSNNAPGIQIIAPYPQKGDIIIVDTGNLNTTNGNGCFTPVASTDDSKYHYWSSSKSYLNTFKDVTDAITINTHAKLKWWYNGTDWELIENVTSCGV